MEPTVRWSSWEKSEERAGRGSARTYCPSTRHDESGTEQGIAQTSILDNVRSDPSVLVVYNRGLVPSPHNCNGQNLGKLSETAIFLSLGEHDV